MGSINTVKQYLPYSGHEYVALEKDDVTIQSTLEANIKSSNPITSIFSKSWLGLFCFLLGLFTGVSFFYYFPQEHALLTTPGVPRSITETVTFSSRKADPRFDMEKQDNESVAAWETLRSRFIWVDQPMQKGLQPSWPKGADRQIYSIASFHQLHCTYVIYFAWHSLIKDGPSVLNNEYPGSRGEYTIGGHFGHCVEIIRQALMCYADATLEPMLEIDGQTISEIGLASGWGTLHTCRNFNKLTEWIDAQDKGVADFADPTPETAAGRV